MSTTAVIVILAALAVVAIIAIVAVKLKSKNVDGVKTLEKVTQGLNYAQAISIAISPFLPAIANSVIAMVLSKAQQAVVRVEASYKAALATDPNAADTRKTEAISLVKSALTLEGITETPEIDKLIDTAIPLLVLALPKTHDTTSDKTAAAQAVPQTTANQA